jgi:hypothetical protein
MNNPRSFGINCRHARLAVESRLLLENANEMTALREQRGGHHSR